MTIRLFLLNPDSAWTGQVNQSSFVYPLGEVTYDNGAAVITPQVEMTVLFGTMPGADDLGRTRLRDASLGASGTIKIGRSSQGNHDGEVALQDDAYITILNDFRVWAKIPYIAEDGTIYKDHDLEVGSYTQNLPPKANLGVGFAATIDPSTNVITASWDASSYSFANSGSISSYLWDVDDGTITVGSSSTAAITATFSAGFRWVSVTITDSYSNTHTMRVPVFARDPDNDRTIGAFTIDRHRITPQGQVISLTVREAIPESTYPDGTLVMLWEDEPASSDDRSHMIFIGWHQADPAKIKSSRTATLKDVSLQCVDVAGRLDSLPGFSQSIASATTPAGWEQMSYPNLDKFMHYLLHWHSNALDLANWNNSGQGALFSFVLLDSDGDSLWEQVDKRAHAFVPDRIMTCDTLGRMAIKVDPLLQDTGDRTPTSQATLNEDDWSEISYEYQRAPRYHWLWGSAIVASPEIISAVFCVAPGSAAGQGEIEYTSGEQLAQSQSDLNACEGHRYARLNAPQSRFRLELAAGDDLDLEPADMTWITLNVTADTAAQRGLTFSSARFLIQEISIRYKHQKDALLKSVSLELERETSGFAAETYTIPVNDIPPPEWVPPDDGTYDDDPGETSGDGLGTAYVFLSDVLAKTSNLGAASPIWSDITSTITGTSFDYILDPWNPSSRAFALTSAGVWRIDNLDTTPSYTQVLTAADVVSETGDSSLYTFAQKIQASINIEDYIVLFVVTEFGSTDYHTWCFYSYDAGDTWSATQVAEHASIASAGGFPAGGFDVVPHTINNNLTIWCLLGHNAGNTEQLRIYRSQDAGANFTLLDYILEDYTTGAHRAWAVCVNTPYLNNEAGNIVWASIYSANYAAERFIVKTTNGFSSWDTISLPNSTKDYTHIKRLGIEIYVPDNQLVTIWNADDQFFRSLDGSNFSEISYSGYVPATHGNVYAAGGFPSLAGRYYILTNQRYVFVSSNGGSTFENKTGNLRSIITSDETPTGNPTLLLRSGTIVPYWLAE